MADDITTLEAQLTELRQIRGRGVLRVQYSDGRSVQYASSDELGRAIADLERRLAALTGQRVGTLRIYSAKGV